MNFNVKIGNLVRDPDELKHVGDNNTPLVKFRIAVDDFGQRETEFFDVTVFGKQAEACANYLGKGRTVAVVGKDRISTYTDSNEVKRISHEIIADRVKFLGGGKNNRQSNNNEPSDEIPPEAQNSDAPF